MRPQPYLGSRGSTRCLRNRPRPGPFPGSALLVQTAEPGSLVQDVRSGQARARSLRRMMALRSCTSR